jgi:hypothetical protein
MATTEERIKILKMVQEGKISAEDASHLIGALEERDQPKPAAPPPPPPARGGHWFRVKITDTQSGKTRVNVRLPIGLVDAGIKMGARLSPEVQGLDADQLKQIINAGEMGKIVDVFNDDDSEHVEVYIE